MKKITLVLVGAALFASTAWASDLYNEFQRRDALANTFTREDRNALNFLRTMQFAVETIVEFESLGADGKFAFRDNKDVVCFGDQVKKIIRCKNNIGLTLVSYQGDND
jgi:hypothetical protein